VASEAFSFSRITGSAVATTCVSSDTISDAAEVSASTQRCPAVVSYVLTSSSSWSVTRY